MKPLTIYWIPGVHSCKDYMFPKVFSFGICETNFKINIEILELILPIVPGVENR
ncbi:16726_t:CDS:2, partial [Dentiscutata heterogama]